MEFTIVLALDAKHLQQLELTLPTLVRFRREMTGMPWLCICDRSGDTGVQFEKVRDVFDGVGIATSRVRLVNWPPLGMPYGSQRERMLAGFVHAAPRHVETPYWMKWDTDAFATRSDPNWLPDQWFRAGDAFCAPSWGYTKPEDQMAQLDDWADGVDGLKDFARLDLPYEIGSGKCRHKRMCSWVSFYETEWTRHAASYCTEYGVIPVPSQDGFHSYVAAREKTTWSPYPAKKLGWANIASTKRLRIAVNEAILVGDRPDVSSDQRVSLTSAG